MVSSTLPVPSGPSLPPSPTLDEILAPHHAINPPANITRIPTDAERRAAWNAGNASTPAPTDTPAPAPYRSTFAPFRPDAHALESILSQLTSSIHSLDSIAARHNTSVGALTLWMSRPDVQPILDQLESGCYRHARLAAAHELPQAVNALSLILSCASEAESQLPIPREARGIILRERSRTNTRKAAWLLYRISRSHPSIPMDAATRLKLEQTRLERAQLKAHLRAQVKAQSKAQSKDQLETGPKAQLSPSRGTAFGDSASDDTAFGGTTGEVQSGVSSSLNPGPHPSSASGSPSPTPSLSHSVTAPTDFLPPASPSVPLRDLRGEDSSSDRLTPLDDHDAMLLPCGMTPDSS